MATLFYDHLLIMEEMVIILDAYGLPNEERKKLLSLIDETLHHHILDEILNNLPKEFHTEFLDKYSQYPHDQSLLTYLKEKTPGNIEKKMLQRANTIKKQLKQHIKETLKKDL